MLTPRFQNKDLTEAFNFLDSRIAQEIFWNKRFELIQCVLGAGDFRFLPKDLRRVLSDLFFFATAPGLRPRSNGLPMPGNVVHSKEYSDSMRQWIEFAITETTSPELGLSPENVQILFLTFDQPGAYGYFHSPNIDPNSYRFPTRTQCRDWILNAQNQQNTNFYLNAVKYISVNKLELSESNTGNMMSVLCGINAIQRERGDPCYQIALVVVEAFNRISVYQASLPSPKPPGPAISFITKLITLVAGHPTEFTSESKYQAYLEGWSQKLLTEI